MARVRALLARPRVRAVLASPETEARHRTAVCRTQVALGQLAPGTLGEAGALIVVAR